MVKRRRVRPSRATRSLDGRQRVSSDRTPRISRQFWQAGEFLPEADEAMAQRSAQPGLDHARLHPRFLHSNATSHKWALGALVELLDNSMDEVTAGRTPFPNEHTLEAGAYGRMHLHQRGQSESPRRRTPESHVTCRRQWWGHGSLNHTQLHVFWLLIEARFAIL